MRLQITFSDQQRINIVLFDNPSIKKWFNHFGKQYKNYHHRVIFPFVANHEVNTLEAWANICNAVNKIKSYGYDLKEPPLKFDSSQDTLNYWHRFFTYNVLWWQNADKNIIKNPFDENFIIPSDLQFDEWFRVLDIINQAVHKLETVTSTDNKSLLKKQYIDFPELHFNQHRNPLNLDAWLSFTEEEQKLNYNSYINIDQPLILLDNEILGKSVLQSFVDQDDPTANDCTGRLGSYGGFVIELNKYRQQIYKSNEFQNWLTRHGMQSTDPPYEFPLGYVEHSTFKLDQVDAWQYASLLNFEILFLE